MATSVLTKDPSLWPDDWRAAWEERAAIMQYRGELTRKRAEVAAAVLLRREYRSRRAKAR